MGDNSKWTIALGLGAILVFVAFTVWIVGTIWAALVSVDSKLALGMVTAFTTVVVATLTLTLGKYFERRREIDTHFREKKTEMYDEFLKELYKVFHSAGEDSAGDDLDEAAESEELVDFLRLWQQELLLRGGAGVVSTYLKWMAHLTNGEEPNAESMLLTGDFILALRKDLGLRNSGIDRRIFAQITLKNPKLFLQMASSNPSVTLSEIDTVEKTILANRANDE